MLEVNGLSKSYNGVNVVKDFQVHVKKGHIYGVVGPNGAGKTTFFKMLAGLVIPTAGTVKVSNGEPIETYRQKMSFMIEAPYLYENMTAMDNMKIIGGIKGEKDVQKMKGLLELVKLDPLSRKKVKKFSLGMRQRLGIACALTSNPEILVLDEPMNGVDPEGIVELRETLLWLCEEKNITMLISSHILGELAQLSSDFIFVKQGCIVKQIEKETLQHMENGNVQIATTKLEETYRFICEKYDPSSVVLRNDYIEMKTDVGEESKISKMLVDAGFCITKMNVETLDLEQYYMKEIVGNEA